MPKPLSPTEFNEFTRTARHRQQWATGFFLADGFPLTTDDNQVAKEWLLHADEIHFNGVVLSAILEEVRAAKLGQMIIDFIAVEDENIRTSRRKAWDSLVAKLLPNDNAFSDGEKCRHILTKLAHDDYAKHYDLEKYNIASDEAIVASLIVMNVVLKQAFDFLTIRDNETVTQGIQDIIIARLLQTLPVDRNEALLTPALQNKKAREDRYKKVFTKALLQYATYAGMFTALPAAHIANLPSHCKGEVTKIHIDFNFDGQSIIGKILTVMEVSDVESKRSADKAVSEVGINFQIDGNGEVSIKVVFANSYLLDEELVDKLEFKWRQKLNDLENYVLRYILMQKHDEQKLNTLYNMHAEIYDKADYGCWTFFRQPLTVSAKAQALFDYIAEQDHEFITTLQGSLNHYAAKGEDQFTFAVIVLCALGKTNLAIQAIQPYIDHGHHNLTHKQKTDEGFIRRAYRFMRKHGVYVIFDLSPEMKFVDATVFSQHPARFLQFDHAGNMSELAKGEVLQQQIPSFSENFLKVYRFSGVVDYVKPSLSVQHIMELNQFIGRVGGNYLPLTRDSFEYPNLSEEVNPNIVPIENLESRSYYRYPSRVTS